MGPVPSLDQLMANAWPASFEVRRHGWRFRWTSGVTRRANSVLAAGAADRIPGLVREAERFYADRQAPPRFQVTTASAPQGLAAHLEAHGYAPDARTLMQVAATGTVRDRTVTGPWTAGVGDHPSGAWFDAYWAVESANGHRPGDAGVCRAVLLDPVPPARYVNVSRGGEVCAVGQVVVEDGWGGVQCVATLPDHRRRGAALAVLHHLAREGASLGAHHLYLAVMADNLGARQLYRRLGFTTSHEYCYYARP